MPQDTKKRILDKIRNLEKERSDWFVKEETIQLIMQYCKQGDFKEVLEIGTHIGYSALHLALVADHITTIEKDKIFIVEARRNLKKFKKEITLIEANALDILSILNEANKKYDCIFIDANKPDYAEFLRLSIPLLSDNGVIFIDNTISHKKKVPGFFPALKKSGLSYKELNVGDGLIIALKTRKFFQTKQ
ncbi:hypothetical protein CL619_04295 [archaeon]|nr:hypothetical protein [archaeon]|tara:strand:+ start:54 stop:623 length:570 start_codon:yes stop_codon:yes gene_type:complete